MPMFVQRWPDWQQSVYLLMMYTCSTCGFSKQQIRTIRFRRYWGFMPTLRHMSYRNPFLKHDLLIWWRRSETLHGFVVPMSTDPTATGRKANTNDSSLPAPVSFQPRSYDAPNCLPPQSAPSPRRWSADTGADGTSGCIHSGQNGAVGEASYPVSILNPVAVASQGVSHAKQMGNSLAEV